MRSVRVAPNPVGFKLVLNFPIVVCTRYLGFELVCEVDAVWVLSAEQKGH